MKDLLLKGFMCILLAGLALLQSCKTSEPDYHWDTAFVRGEYSWNLTLTEQNEESYSMVLTGPLLGTSRITGEAYSESGGSWLIHLDSLEWFHNHNKGWTEGSFLLWGTLRLETRGDNGTLQIVESPWIDSVTAGAIRYKDKVLSGDRGRDQLQRRWTRVDALQEILHQRLPHQVYPTLDVRGFDRETPSFNHDLGELLLPEIFGYPSGFNAAEEPSDYSSAEGYRWDTLYSQDLLPEEWRELRDSGTLYRDFEEAYPLFWTLYNWEWIWEKQIPSLILEIDKK